MGHASPLARVVTCLREASVHPVPAYVTIFLLQLKVVWDMWRVRDLTTGDTASYFVMAHAWHTQGDQNPLWSPLYLVYYGSFLGWTADAHRATTAHRLVLVLVVAPLVLALMRRLLEPRIAWFVAAWWVVLPINHDAIYEVHLFGVLPVIVAALVLSRPPTAWRLGAGLGALLAGCLFVRNELLVAVVLLALACALYEVRRPADGESRPARRWRRLAYATPLVVCLLLAVAFFAQSFYTLREARAYLWDKHALNVCQIYAYGYQQRRYTDWPKNPWTECQDLMVRTFGQPLLTMGEAVRANPRAMLEHFSWNVGLIPSGIQLLLFNQISGTVRPGYEELTVGSSLALTLGVLLILLFLGGAVVMARDWGFWWSTWVRPRVWGWLVLASVAVGSVVVMVTQRPRPSYLFGLELGLQACAGLCAQALLHRWRAQRWLAAAFPGLVCLLLLLVPGYYADAPTPPPRPLREAYRALRPFQAMIQAPGTVIVTPGYAFEICAYLRDRPAHMCQALDYYGLRAEVHGPTGWWPLLSARGATMFYANEAMMADPVVQRSLAGAEAAGWEVLMRRQTGRGERVLLRRRA